MLNPLWIRSAAALAEHGSFTRAAAALDLTQAAVSQHVRQLEERLGPIVIRRPRSLEWTPAGLALLDHARELEAADRRFAARIAGNEAQQGDVTLITPGSVGLLLYPMLLDIQAEHPELVIRHRFAPDRDVIEALLSNACDFGIATTKPDDARLSATAFLQEPLELIVPAGETVTGWTDLERIGFIDHPDGQAMATRLLSRRFGGNPGVRKLPIRGFSNQIALILEPVARGFGFTVLPRYARQAFRQPEAISVAEGSPAVTDTLWLIHRAEWPLPARATKVLRSLSKLLGI
ncbi:LysR family transcriptional regulator [Sphingomonas oryzagri]|uniref:LysR family transcriptional regulator n=1 Tax=Sphingomonas oryzagri TaxID=3042314 RepID=A0ABT6MXM6_9SPHN|nr:LysR family transcriptional regulator [Sphingomonas oryzagri]MDH7637756.1 LysR family transcriptional regulator [Sphingomonas oryzagri]